jgi:hypothetical protein
MVDQPHFPYQNDAPNYNYNHNHNNNYHASYSHNYDDNNSQESIAIPPTPVSVQGTEVHNNQHKQISRASHDVAFYPRCVEPIIAASRIITTTATHVQLYNHDS